MGMVLKFTRGGAGLPSDLLQRFEDKVADAADAAEVADAARVVIEEAQTAVETARAAAEAAAVQAHNEQAAGTAARGEAVAAAGTAVERASAAAGAAGQATTAAGEAGLARDGSQASAVAALLAQVKAEAARDLSQTYANASLANAKFYDTIALGRAAVADGGTFGVKAGGADGLARATIYRRDSETAQTLVVTLAPGAELDANAAAMRAELSKTADAVSIFWPPPTTVQPIVVDRGKDGVQRVILGVNADGTGAGLFPTKTDIAGLPSKAELDAQAPPWRPRFMSSLDAIDGKPMAWVNTDESGAVIRAWDASGAQIFPRPPQQGVDFSALPASSQNVPAGAPWALHRSVRVQRSYGNLYTDLVSTLASSVPMIYAHYDALMAEFPTYITSSVVGRDNHGNDLREWVFTPSGPAYTGGWSLANDLTFPTIVIESGIHGNEREAMLNWMIFFRELCSNWREDELLARLRYQCRFIIVPTLSPTGVNNNTRENADGLNLNRESRAVPPPPEVAVALNLPVRYPDACGFIDAHNMWGFAPDETSCWLGFDRREDLGIGLAVTRRLAAYEAREFDFMPQEQTNMTGVTQPVVGGIVGYWGAVQKKRSFLFETPGLTPPSNARRPHMRRHNLQCIKVLVEEIFNAEIRKREAGM